MQQVQQRVLPSQSEEDHQLFLDLQEQYNNQIKEIKPKGKRMVSLKVDIHCWCGSIFTETILREVDVDSPLKDGDKISEFDILKTDKLVD